MSDTTLHAQLLDDSAEMQAQRDAARPKPVTAAERYAANRALDELDATTPVNERVFR